jgi:hypothetical protein
MDVHPQIAAEREEEVLAVGLGRTQDTSGHNRRR